MYTPIHAVSHENYDVNKYDNEGNNSRIPWPGLTQVMSRHIYVKDSMCSKFQSDDLTSVGGV